MNLPPKLGVTTDKNVDLSAFDCIVKQANHELKKRGKLTLNFGTYEEMKASLMTLELGDLEKAHQLCVEANAWYIFLAEMKSIATKHYLDLEAEKKRIHSEESQRANQSSKGASDAIADTQPSVINAREARNTLETLCEMLDYHVKYLDKAYYISKATWEWAEKNKSNDSKNK